MRRNAIIAAVGSVLAIASFSEAAFTLSAAPSIRPSTAAGTSAFDLFALNDVGGVDGNALQGLQFTFTGTNGTQALFTSEPNDEGTGFNNDTYNFSSTSTSANPAPVNVNRSNLRIGSASSSEQTFTNIPGNFDTNITTFSADYAILSAATAVTRATATTPPGARFARLVFNTATPTFTITGNFGGESGTKTPASLTFPGGVVTTTPPVNVSPTVIVTPTTLTIDVSGAGLEGGAATITAADADGTIVSLNRVLTSSAQAAGGPVGGGSLTDNITQTSNAGNTLTTFTLSNLTFADRGTYVFTFTATDNGTPGATGTGTLTVNIVPEPTTLAALGMAGLGLIRRRK